MKRVILFWLLALAAAYALFITYSWLAGHRGADALAIGGIGIAALAAGWAVQGLDRILVRRFVASKEWVFLGHSVDGEPFAIDGINVWDYEWQRGDKAKVKVADPAYGQIHAFSRYTIDAEDRRIEFVAGEFSNCVWGFYVRRS